MDTTLHDVLCAKVCSDMEALEEMDVGSDGYRTAIDGITKLADRAIEVEKIEADLAEKAAAREFEAEQKRKQQEDDQRHRIIGYVLTGLGIVAPIVATVWCTHRTLRFDEGENILTTTAGRSLISNCLRK